MSLQEMIELAILDAMGLLDEEERVAFEIAFRSAAPAVQAQIRREQTRLSHIEALLPEVQAPAGLRAAVIQAVRREIAAAEASSPNPALMIADSMVKPRAVSPLWRAAAMGLAAAAVVFGITTFQFQAQLEKLAVQFQNDRLLQAMNEEFGPSFMRDVLFDHDTRRVVLTPSDTGFKGEASMFLNPEWKEAMFFCRAMATPEGRTLKLAIIDPESGSIVKELATFTSDGGLKPLRVPLNPTDRGRLAVLTTSGGGEFDRVMVRGELPGPSL